MSKIIIHNETKKTPNAVAARAVASVIDMGFVSGEDQYCWATHFPMQRIDVFSNHTRGATHTFKVRDAT